MTTADYDGLKAALIELLPDHMEVEAYRDCLTIYDEPATWRVEAKDGGQLAVWREEVLTAEDVARVVT